MEHKVDWSLGDPVASSDMNRIERNTEVHVADNGNPHNVTKQQIQLGNVTNDKQMPLSGGTFTSKAIAQSSTGYTTKQVRNIILSSAAPKATDGSDGDIWLKYYREVEE